MFSAGAWLRGLLSFIMRTKGLLGAGWIPTGKGAEGQHKQPSAAASSTLFILCLYPSLVSWKLGREHICPVAQDV